ncbi:MAG: acyltransferase [Deltaproteobacteria bacterium]|nr:acyltransferase [Deltaproteobacteria bacterium]
MFGTYRYVLALMVACGHIQFQLFGRPNWLGLYAVFGFYTLSGYLMTRVLHETYGYTAHGFLHYITNRALRILPPYWLALLWTIALLMILPDAAGQAAWLVHLPTTVIGYARNFALVGMHMDFHPALVPTAWSLHVEVIFYLMMGIGLSASSRRAAVWLGASAAWTVWAVASGIPFGDRYSNVLGASLPFSTGAVLYFLRNGHRRWMLLAPIAFVPHALAAPWIWPDVQLAGFYVSYLLAAVSVLALVPLRASPRWRALDRRLGDLSYPIFLLHTQVSFLVAKLWPHYSSLLALFVLTLPVLHVFAVLVHWCAVSSVENLRDRVRSASVASQEGR